MGCSPKPPSRAENGVFPPLCGEHRSLVFVSDRYSCLWMEGSPSKVSVQFNIRRNMRKLANMTSIAAITAVAALMSSGPLLRAAEDDTGKAKTEQHGQLVRKDFKFVRDAAQGGLLEVKLGELAKQKGTSPTVQKFGDQMVADHSKANDEL